MSTIGNSVHNKFGIPVPSIHFAAKETFPLLKTTSLTELSVKCINGWLRGWRHSRFCPIVSLHSFHTFGFIKPQDTLRALQKYRHILECSSPWLKIFATTCARFDSKLRQLYCNVWIFGCIFFPHFTMNFRNCKYRLCSACVWTLLQAGLNFWVSYLVQSYCTECPRRKGQYSGRS
jgi:hypothetical protein